jgi:DNA-binding Lrp family transcriptional regulator
MKKFLLTLLTVVACLFSAPTAGATEWFDVLSEGGETIALNPEIYTNDGGVSYMVWVRNSFDLPESRAYYTRDRGYDKIAERIARFPEVSSLYLTSGTSEFLLSINAKTMREVADFVGEKLAPLEGVASTVTMFVLKKYKVNGVTMEIKAEVEDDRLPVSA